MSERMERAKMDIIFGFAFLMIVSASIYEFVLKTEPEEKRKRISETTMTTRTRDYSQLTDEQLNRLVAERLGYHAVHDGYHWLLLSPKAEYLPAYFSSEERAWASLHIPWASSIDAAAALDFGDAMLIIERYPELTWVSVRGFSFRVHHEIEATARTIAWLLMKDAMAAE